MYDALTLDDLYALHSETCAGIHAIGNQMLDGDTPRLPVFSDEWAVLSARQGELLEAAVSVYAEILHREVEAIASRLGAPDA